MRGVLPEKFVESLVQLLGENEAKELCEALEGTSSPISVRYNPFKITEAPQGKQVPWCRYGYLLEERPQFTLDPLFHAGAYYVQEASSMFIEHVYREVMGERKGLRVLDLCAAPGGKTTLLSTLVGLEGIVVANEVIRQRAMALADNVRKWGLGNVAVTNNDPSHLSDLRDYFDLVLVDAPCSGEGMFRKNIESAQEWSVDNVRLCAQRQRRILADVWGSLKPGGVLVYSTCTFNRAENEENIEWLINEYECQGIDIEVDSDWGVVEGIVSNADLDVDSSNPSLSDGDNVGNPSESDCNINTFRFYPHRVLGEGLFVAVVRKKPAKAKVKSPKPRRLIFAELQKHSSKAVGHWFKQPEYMHHAAIGENIYSYYASTYPVVKMLSETMSVVYSGVMTGQLFGKKLRPEHPLALFHDLDRSATQEVEVDKETALQYLRKLEIDSSILHEGVNLLTFKGVPIGWVKRIGNRSNNQYPKELRIMNL